MMEYNREINANYSNIWCRGCNFSGLAPLLEKEDRTKVKKIIRAIQRGQQIAISYEDSEHDITERVIRPEALAEKQLFRRLPSEKDNCYYLIAYCYLRQDFRTFKISRILDVISTGKTAMPTDYGIELQEKCARKLQKEIDKAQKHLEELKQELNDLNEQAKVDSHNPDSPSTEGLLQKLQQQQQEISSLTRKTDDNASTFKFLTWVIIVLLLGLLGSCIYTHSVKEDKTCPKCKRYEKRIRKVKDFMHELHEDDEYDEPRWRVGPRDWR